MKFGEDFKHDVKINKFKLEEECERQPSLYYYYSELLAEAKSDKDKAASKFSLITSEVDISVRNDPDSPKKLTEALIKSIVTVDLKVVKAQKEYDDAKRKVYTLEVAVNSIEHRKSMLNNLVQLYCKNYYSQPGNYDSNDQAQQEVRMNLGSRRENNE